MYVLTDLHIWECCAQNSTQGCMLSLLTVSMSYELAGCSKEWPCPCTWYLCDQMFFSAVFLHANTFSCTENAVRAGSLRTFKIMVAVPASHLSLPPCPSAMGIQPFCLSSRNGYLLQIFQNAPTVHWIVPRLFRDHDNVIFSQPDGIKSFLPLFLVSLWNF